jgi:hypothetical protein
VNPATYGGHSDESFDQFVFGGATFDAEAQRMRYEKFKKHINDIYSRPIDEGGDGMQGELMTGTPDQDIKHVSGTGFSRTLTERTSGDYGPSHCGRYAHDVMTANGWVGPKRTPGGQAAPSQVKSDPGLRVGGVLTGSAANTIANLRPGMVVHLRPTSVGGKVQYPSGHFAVISDNMTLNEDLGGSVRCDRPVSHECGIDSIDWAAMPKYRK